jgi:hypothetical protein
MIWSQTSLGKIHGHDMVVNGYGSRLEINFSISISVGLFYVGWEFSVCSIWAGIVLSGYPSFFFIGTYLFWVLYLNAIVLIKNPSMQN